MNNYPKENYPQDKLSAEYQGLILADISGHFEQHPRKDSRVSDSVD
jgi:hypothetical protein